MSKDKIVGTCLCGAVTVTLSNPAGWVGVCHCKTCRKHSGGLWASFPAAADTVSVDGKVTTFVSSPIAERTFCGTCGTPLWMRDTTVEEADYDMMPGLFDATQDWPLHSEIYTDEAPKAFCLKGNHKRATAAEYRAKNPEVNNV